MTKTKECNKICLKADSGMMLYHEKLGVYTPKAYLFTEAEEADWTEVDASTIPSANDLTSDEALDIILGGAT